ISATPPETTVRTVRSEPVTSRGPPSSARAIGAPAGAVKTHSDCGPVVRVPVAGSGMVKPPRAAALDRTAVTAPEAGPTSDGRYSHACDDTAPPTTSTLPSSSRASEGAASRPSGADDVAGAARHR